MVVLDATHARGELATDKHDDGVEEARMRRSDDDGRSLGGAEPLVMRACAHHTDTMEAAREECGAHEGKNQRFAVSESVKAPLCSN